jgi:DNA polymerase III delta subunit
VLFADLKASLKLRVSPAYQMAGGDVFLINKSIELILAEAKVEPLAIVRMDETALQDEINAALSNISMFGGQTAVVVRAPEFVRVFLAPIKRESEIEKVDCNPMTESLVVRLILSQNKRFSAEAATQLARMCENNFSQVVNEITKLENLFPGETPFSVDAVKECVKAAEHYQVFELSGALLKGDAVRAAALIDNFAETIDDYAVFGALLSFARRLFYAKFSNEPDTVLAAALGVAPFAITATRRDSRNVSQEKAARVYRRALELEYEIKSGVVLANRALLLLSGELI